MSQTIRTKPIKVVLLGDSGVGKTSLMNRFATDKYDSESKSTMGATFLTKAVDFKEYNTQLKYEIWDTAGQEKYKSIIKLFYKDAVAVILVYSITSKRSYEELINYWSKEITSNAQENVIKCVAANKSDLIEDEEVDEEEAKKFAKSINAGFKQTSAKTKNGVEGLFQYIGEKICNPNASEKAEGDKAGGNNEGEESKKGQKLKKGSNNKKDKEKRKCC